MNDLGAGGDLHQQLSEVIHRSGPMHFDWCTTRCSGPTAMERGQASAVVHIVEGAVAYVEGERDALEDTLSIREVECAAAVAAAQADTAARIAAAIEAEMVEDRAVGRVTVGGVTPWERCAALARAVGVPGTETADE